MSQLRVVRVISYEGIDEWVQRMLRQGTVPTRPGGTFFAKSGTIKELFRIELAEDERLVGLDGIGKQRGPAPDRG